VFAPIYDRFDFFRTSRDIKTVQVAENLFYKPIINLHIEAPTPEG